MPSFQKNSKKILVLGEPSSGKTSLINALLGGNFDHFTKPTKAIEETTYSIKENNSIFVDFSGQIIMSNIDKILSYINDNQIEAVLYIFDVRQGNINDSLSHWVKLLPISTIDKLSKFLVISRSDLVSNVESIIDKKYINKNFQIENIIYTSSKDGVGIEELREKIRVLVNKKDDTDEIVHIIVKTMIEKLCKAIAQNPDTLNLIEWRDLERIIAESLEEIGFSVDLTPLSKDGGKDIIVKCKVQNKDLKYYIEIKHWREGGKPNDKYINQFIQINAFDNTDGGIFISTSGYTKSIYNRVAELSKQNIRLGDKKKIVTLCKYYKLSKDGLWNNETPLPELLFEDTL